MGLLNTLKSAVVDANEQAHAARLQRDLPLTMQQIDALPDNLKVQALQRFLESREVVVRDIANWSRNGALSIAKGFFRHAKREYALNKKDALAHALAGLWLEGGVRNSDTAADVHETIEALANAMLGASQRGDPPQQADDARRQRELPAHRDTVEATPRKALQSQRRYIEAESRRQSEERARWQEAEAAWQKLHSANVRAMDNQPHVNATDAELRQESAARERAKGNAQAITRREQDVAARKARNRAGALVSQQLRLL